LFGGGFGASYSGRTSRCDAEQASSSRQLMDVRILHSYCVNDKNGLARFYRGTYQLSSFVKNVALDLNGRNFFFIFHKGHFCTVIINYESYDVLVAFIDSLVLPELWRNAVVQDYLLRFAGSYEAIRHLNFPVQSRTSMSCGKYCLYFAYQICVKDQGFNKVTSVFSASDLNRNEKLIQRWFQQWTTQRGAKP
jgi:hypothetical protein